MTLPSMVDCQRIWGKSPHNAFTDLAFHQGRWWCVFREGLSHVSPDGALRIITSRDGTAWESAALICSEKEDLRDAKISVTPDGQLMLLGAGALHQPSAYTHQSYVWLSGDGEHWSEPQAVGEPDFWLWRATWHDERCYGIGYRCGPVKRARLYESQDGLHFAALVPDLGLGPYPNESSLVFDPDNTARCLLRRDPDTALLGKSRPPYTHWEWSDTGVRIGGPVMLRLPDGRLVAAVRLYDGQVRTSLCWVDATSARLDEFLALPSGGDTSYAGLVWHDGLLWVSYYSSHEEKTAIYLARARV